MSVGIVVSLCDYTGNMVRPWAEDGYTCYCFDTRHEEHSSERIGKGMIVKVKKDVTNLSYIPQPIDMAFAFPPCTNLAVSGARWFRSKGLRGLIDGLAVVEACREFCENSGAKWMLENPVSTLSTYWRKPDYSFQPHEYVGYEGGADDNYTKKTCLWTGGGFVMPEPRPGTGVPDDRIHKMPPSDERGNLRSETPRGFARAVFEANSNRGAVPAAIGASDSENTK